MATPITLTFLSNNNMYDTIYGWSLIKHVLGGT